MDLFKPDLARTFLPACSVVPAADLDMFLTCKSSIHTIAWFWPFVLVLPDGTIGGYHTLSATSLKLTEFPADITRKLPRYPLIPATLLGRLAVDQNYQGRGYGRFLLADALLRAVRSEIASFAAVVDAKDEAAAAFYRHVGFRPFASRPMSLFLPIATALAAFGGAA